MACIATPFLTRDPSRRGWRGPLYAWYASLSALVIYDLEQWITMPRMWIVESIGGYSDGIGIILVWAMIIGFSVAVVIALFEKRPTTLHLDTLITGATSGAVVLFCFFKVAWAVPTIWKDPGFSLTGFDLAYQHWFYLGTPMIPYFDAVSPHISLYFWPTLLYSIVALGMLLIITAALNGKNNRVELPRLIQLVCGAVIVFLTLLVIASNTIIPQSGVLTTLAVGVFLIIYQTTILLSRRHTRNQNKT